MPAAVLWDFDGLVIDSEMADATAWREEFGRAGWPLDLASYAGMWAEWSRRRLVRIEDHLQYRSPRLDMTAAGARRRARYADLCAALPARPGIAAWMAQARQDGLVSAVVTNNDSGAAAHLARLGLDQYISAVVAPGPGLRRKPAPDLYLAALARLGLSGQDAVAVEDSPHGLAAAAAAGLASVAVPSELTAHLDLSAAGTVILDPASLPLSEALDRAREAGPRTAPETASVTSAERHLGWARRAAAGNREPWHYLTSRMLQTALAVTRHDGPEAGAFPRAAMLLAALAFWDIAGALDATDLENLPVAPVLALLAGDDTARASLSACGPALLPADRCLLDGVLAAPGEWEAARSRAHQLIARASELNLGHGAGAPRLALLSARG